MELGGPKQREVSHVTTENALVYRVCTLNVRLHYFEWPEWKTFTYLHLSWFPSQYSKEKKKKKTQQQQSF